MDTFVLNGFREAAADLPNLVSNSNGSFKERLSSLLGLCKPPFSEESFLLDNILDIIHEEDEYEYFKKNCKDLDFDIETLIEYSKENKQPNIQEKKENSLIYKVGSTTLITALLTYIVYFVL